MNSVIDEKIAKILTPLPEGPHAALFDAARYSLRSGKRIRPRLCIATAQTFGATVDQALLPAAALELIHTYSLIHDDLPCMDDDDFRRGQPSLHKATSESTALLAGNLLLNRAYEVLVEASHLTESQKLQLLALCAKSANDLLTGQFLDLASEGRTIDADALQLMHVKKTAALFMAAVEFGAIIGNAPQRERELVRGFGEQLGLAFQMRDDLDDALSAGSDQTKEKATAVALFGVAGVKQKISSLHSKSMQFLDGLPGGAPLLRKFVENASKV